jgi:hypothetical protein
MSTYARTLNASSRIKIIMLGYLVRGPIGGLAWHHLQYVMGLQRMGHEVYFLEDSEDYASCYNPRTQSFSKDPEYGLAFTQSAFQSLGLGETWAYYDAHTSSWLGPLGDKAVTHCEQADMLLNISAINPVRPWLESIPIFAVKIAPFPVTGFHGGPPDNPLSLMRGRLYPAPREGISRPLCNGIATHRVDTEGLSTE